MADSAKKGPSAGEGDANTTISSSNTEREEEIPPPPPLKMATLLVKCPDRTGVVAAVGTLLNGFNTNIVESEQFTDDDNGMYSQRLRFDYSHLSVGAGNTTVLETALTELAERYAMEWRMSYDEHGRMKIILLVTKEEHCLYDLLIRQRRGELCCDIVGVVSNHDTLRPVADMFEVPYFFMPIKKKSEGGGGKRAQELQIEELMKEKEVDLVVLARYMQILSKEFCEAHWSKTINIHHSFLPAFEGAKPYHRAHERGVKLIGATAHFATADLDCGPIIVQDVTSISHRDNVAEMMRRGRDLERMVLAKAVRLFLLDSIIVHGNKTVCFGA